MPTLISQPNKPQSNRLRLKPLYWIAPLVILSALVGGYFVYQNYFLQKTVREIPASAPTTNQITEPPEAIRGDDSRVSKIITAQGNIQPLEGSIWQYGTHTLLDEDGDILYALSSDAVTLDDYNGKKVEVQGSLKEGYPVDGGPPYMEVSVVKEMK